MYVAIGSKKQKHSLKVSVSPTKGGEQMVGCGAQAKVAKCHSEKRRHLHVNIGMRRENR